MKDHYGREINYLRISVTDLCNLRCVYCMPETGVQKLRHRDILTAEEIVEIAAAAVELGVNKIRITGGEPLTKPDIAELCSKLSSLPGLRELSLTTNGLRLGGLARELREAGIRRVNVSLDSLDPEKYRRIARGGSLEDVLAGIEAARAVGMGIKLNAVLIGGFNDGEIADFAALTLENELDMRFIELMPIGEAAQFPPEAFLSADTVLERLPELMPDGDSGVARLYRLPGAKGRVGLISPLSHRFCSECNRIRLTADGKLKPCLHSDEEIPVRGRHGEELKSTLIRVINSKPPCHDGLSAYVKSSAGRNMNEIGG